jgi:sulfite exporter TauE/SafE
MLSFGAGTLPAIGVAVLLAGRITPWLKHATFRAVAGLLLIVSGSVHAAMAVVSSGAIPVPEETKPCCASRGVHSSGPIEHVR